MPKTKIAGYLLIAIAVLKAGADLLDGNGFDIMTHVKELDSALIGAGFIFLRSSIQKIK